MPEWFQGTPPWALALGLLLMVVAIVLILSAFVLGLGSRFQRAESPDGPTLAESAEPLLRARRGVGKFDARFERMAEGTQLGINGETAIGWILLAAAVTAAIVFFFTFISPLAYFSEVFALFAAFIGGFMVFVLFFALRNRRRRAIQDQLPDGCFQLSRSLRSGLALPGALRETSHYLPRPLSGLFARLSAALALGESTHAALRRAAADANLTEFDLFAEVLALNAESGGNLPAMLDRLAASIRDRNQYRGYFRSVTALSRLAAIFLALAAPMAFLLYMIWEEQRTLMFRFIMAPEGQLILLGAVALELIGLVWIAFLLRKQDDY
ncbi:MAG TPA: type II secretion system F family protein [Urbifossiella sp.]|nr:type II secretion system F family protein [Urbifossiella sp.]